jgi:hypothetical protein
LTEKEPTYTVKRISISIVVVVVVVVVVVIVVQNEVVYAINPGV